MLLAKPIHLLLFLVFHALSDLVRLGSIDFLGVFNASMHPGCEHVIIQSALRLRCMLFVLWSAISQLFDKILSVIHICNLFFLFNKTPMGHLRSLNLSYVILPCLFDKMSFVIGDSCLLAA